MSFNLRARLGIAAAAFALAAPALAVDSVKMLIPANPGGGWDTTGRELGKAMTASGAVKNVAYDNKGGAAGAIGIAQFVNSAKGDPNAMMMGGMVMIGGLIQAKSPVTIDQVTPVARLTSEYEVIVVPANGPKTLKELLDKFKANPGSVSFGGGSAGGTDQILAWLIAKDLGVDPTKVNYIAFKGGGEAVSAIIGGHVAAGISGLSEFAQHIKSGKMRALAVSSAKSMEGIPSLKEQGVNVELANWRGIFGAPGITKAQRDELIKVVEKAVKSKEWKDTLKRQEWEDFYLPGDAYGQYLQAESKRIAEVLGSLNVGSK